MSLRFSVPALLGLMVAVAPATPGAAAPLDPPIPAGRKGRLTVELLQAGAVPRALTLNMNMVSTETFALNLLAGGMTEAQSAAQAHQSNVLEENTVDMAEYGRVTEGLTDSCEADEGSAACEAAKARFQAFEAKMEAANARAEAALQSGPAADLDNHRFQRWTGDPQAGCGTAVSRVGGTTRTLTAGPGMSAAEPAFTVCFTELVLDRRTGKVSLRILPLAYAMPGEKQGTFNFLDFDRSSPSVTVDVGFAGVPPSAVFKSLATEGDLHGFSARSEIKTERGAPVTLRVRFEQGG